MQIQTTSKQDRAISVNWHVKSVQIIGKLKLSVTFDDNTKGVVSISPSWLTGVFSELKDDTIFNTANVKHGAVTWDNELDLDPKVMYQAIKNSGTCRIY